MTADVAMTVRGFGEMAITGCVAGPIFNILIGLGLSMTIAILKKTTEPKTVNFGLYTLDGKFDQIAVLPLVLLVG